jgi:hypothetical protein
VLYVTPPVTQCSVANAPARIVRIAKAEHTAAAPFGGRTEILVRIDSASQVIDATVSSSAEPRMDADALAAARASTFATATRDCLPVRSALLVTIEVPPRFPPGFPLPRPLDSGPGPYAFLPGIWSCQVSPAKFVGSLPAPTQERFVADPERRTIVRYIGGARETFAQDSSSRWSLIPHDGQGPIRGGVWHGSERSGDWDFAGMVGSSHRSISYERALPDVFFRVVTSDGVTQTERCSRTVHDSARQADGAIGIARSVARRQGAV